jgi:transmembrane sensor
VSMAAPKFSTEAIFVEAAAWVVRLHGPDRSARVEAGLRRWLAEHPDHRSAFELATETWGSTGTVTQPVQGRFRQWREARPAAWTTLAAAAGAAAVAILIGAFTLLDTPPIQTAVGEQRIVTLDDGTRVSLNTDTRLRLHYSDEVRRIELENGEALFDVAKQPDRPFVVTVGDRTVKALGTAFVIRREETRLAVTLVEGKVSVAEEVLSPGTRVVYDVVAGVKRDRPNLEKLTAWQRGVVMLEDTPLADAITEMNRYSETKLAVEQPQVAGHQVSGIFRAGDSMRFARAVAKTYGLVVVERPDRIVLAGAGVN